MFEKTYFVIIQNTNLNTLTMNFMVCIVVSIYDLYFYFPSMFILGNKIWSIVYIAYFPFIIYLHIHNSGVELSNLSYFYKIKERIGCLRRFYFYTTKEATSFELFINKVD